MSGWCPAGECECLHYHGGEKCGALDPHFCETDLMNIEVCPWPSRQMPVKQELSEREAGRRAGIEECMEAVKHIKLHFNADIVVQREAIAALEKLRDTPRREGGKNEK